MEISAVDYHTGGEPFRIVTGGVEPPRRRDDPRQAARRARAARPRAAAARPRAARTRRHVRLLRRRAERRRRRPRRRLLPQRRLLDRVRARDDRARHVGARRGHRRAAGGREPRRRRRPLGPARHVGARSRAAACARCVSATCRRSSGPQGVELGERTVDVAFGGAFYASLEERVEPSELPRLIELGRELKRELEAWQDVVHPLEPELRDVYGVIFWQEEGEDPLTQRNVTVFADGEVDRSPCGSGTSARLALLDRCGSPAARRGASSPAASSTSEFTRPRRGRGGGGGPPGGGHRGRGQRVPHGRARLRARSGRPARRRVPPPLTS